MAENFVGRQPDYKLSALCKGNEHKGNVGVAWKNANGTIAIKLNAFVVLDANQDLVLTLFLNEGDKWPKKKPVKAEKSEEVAAETGTEDIPF